MQKNPYHKEIIEIPKLIPTEWGDLVVSIGRRSIHRGYTYIYRFADEIAHIKACERKADRRYHEKA